MGPPTLEVMDFRIKTGAVYPSLRLLIARFKGSRDSLRGNCEFKRKVHSNWTNGGIVESLATYKVQNGERQLSDHNQDAQQQDHSCSRNENDCNHMARRNRSKLGRIYALVMGTQAGQSPFVFPFPQRRCIPRALNSHIQRESFRRNWNPSTWF